MTLAVVAGLPVAVLGIISGHREGTRGLGPGTIAALDGLENPSKQPGYIDPLQSTGPTSIGPMSIGPTSIGPTLIAPTSMGPTPIAPTSMGPTATRPVPRPMPPLPQPKPAGPPPAVGLLSLNKPVSVSSIEASWLDGALAVDGDLSTRWGSLEGYDPEWITVDLGSAATISRVVLEWEDAYARAYQIELSTDDQTWTQVYSTTTGNGATDDLSVIGSGRYVRVFGTQRATEYGYSLYELQVYGIT